MRNGNSVLFPKLIQDTHRDSIVSHGPRRLAPLNSKDEVIVAISVEGFNSPFSVLAAFVTDEGKSSRLPRVLVLGEENARYFTDAAKQFLQI